MHLLETRVKFLVTVVTFGPRPKVTFHTYGAGDETAPEHGVGGRYKHIHNKYLYLLNNQLI